jgi:hypothetical protein
MSLVFCCVLSKDNILCTVPYSDMAVLLIECTKDTVCYSFHCGCGLGKLVTFFRNSEICELDECMYLTGMSAKL